MRSMFRIRIENIMERVTGRLLISRQEISRLKMASVTLNDNTKLYKNWEINQLRRVLDLLKPTIIFDIGAHHGEYAEMLLNDVGFSGCIVSVEPNPLAHEILKGKSSTRPNWHVLNLAVGATDGSATFKIMESTQFSSLNDPVNLPTAHFDELNQVRETVQVETSRLSTLFTNCSTLGDCSRAFLKLDTQGSDYSILKASQDVARKMLGIQCELSVIKIYRDSFDMLEVIPFLYESGFSLNSFVPNNPGHFPILIESDAIFINNSILCEHYGLREFDMRAINLRASSD
jgi:FkbM family methyltransferase